MSKLLHRKKHSEGDAKVTFECCYGCEPPKRYPGCHAKCEDYLKAKEEHEARRIAIQTERRRQDDLTGYDVERNRRIARAKGKRKK